MRRWSKVVLVGVVLLAGVAVADARCPDPTQGPGQARPFDVPPSLLVPAVPRPAPSASGPPLLVPAPGGDGDSWQDDRGREYRLGMVDAPEHDECYGSEATAERRRLTAGGFRADVYATDSYGRGVAVVTLPDGANLNVRLARQGFVDDRYVDDFRSEHSTLAAELDAAFEEARRQGRGLWGACP